jgi:hypothetical protein
VRPDDDEVIAYLKGTSGRVREDAERYVRCAPPQIDTNLRRKIEAELGWTPISAQGFAKEMMQRG